MTSAPRSVLFLAAFDSQLKWCARMRDEFRARGFSCDVVVPEVRLLDEGGRALPRAEQSPIPEGASVEVGRRSGGLAEVRWGATEGWVPASSIRLLAP